MPASAPFPTSSRPAGYTPATAAAQPMLHAATGCAGCCVRPYCALAAPDSLCPPDNCPFGLGQATR